MGRPKDQTLPLVPLPFGVVLLPGVTLHVSVANRPDVSSLLTSVLFKPKAQTPEAVSIGCVPLSPQILTSEGAETTEDTDGKLQKWPDNPSGKVREEDMFRYGTVAKIVGLKGPTLDESILILEGVKRFRINKIIRRKPFFQAEVQLAEEEGKDWAPWMVLPRSYEAVQQI